MSSLSEWLRCGDLRSDGAASQAATAVLRNEQLMADQAEGLAHTDAVVRGRTIDAFEKVARSRPDLVRSYLVDILQLLGNEKTMLARMHAAMLFGHLTVYAEVIPQVLPILLDMLDEPTAFTKSWAITSLCIIARKEPRFLQEISNRIVQLSNDPSAAIRTRVRYAMEILADARKSFPKSWIKSAQLDL